MMIRDIQSPWTVHKGRSNFALVFYKNCLYLVQLISYAILVRNRRFSATHLQLIPLLSM